MFSRQLVRTGKRVPGPVCLNGYARFKTVARVSVTHVWIGAALLAWIVGVCWPPVTAASDPFPYELDTGREIVLTGTGLALLGSSRVVANGREPLTPTEIDQLDRSEIGGFDRSATENWSPTASRVSDYLVATLVVSPLLLVATEPGSKRASTVLTMYGETMLINVGVTALLKELVGRTRPFVSVSYTHLTLPTN